MKMWLELIGYEVPPLDEIEDILEQVTADAPLVLAEVKKNGDFINVRVKEVLSGADAPVKEKKGKRKSKAKEIDCPFSKGDQVQFDDDDETIEGKIISIDADGTCTVLSSEDEEWEEIPFNDLTAITLKYLNCRCLHHQLLEGEPAETNLVLDVQLHEQGEGSPEFLHLLLGVLCTTNFALVAAP